MSEFLPECDFDRLVLRLLSRHGRPLSLRHLHAMLTLQELEDANPAELRALLGRADVFDVSRAVRRLCELGLARLTPALLVVTSCSCEQPRGEEAVNGLASYLTLATEDVHSD